MPVPVGSYHSGPSCWDRMKMGFTIGFCVGMASGALFGGFSALRYMRIYTALKDCNVLCFETLYYFLFYQVWTPWKRISEQCGKDDASRWRNLRNIYGNWNRHQVLSVIKYCYNSHSEWQEFQDILCSKSHNLHIKLCASGLQTVKTENDQNRKSLIICIFHVLCNGFC